MAKTTKRLYNFIQGSSIIPNSNFNIWESLGNSGELEFLEFLLSGPKGETGNSAYEEWKLNGNEGKSFDDFILSFKGPNGESAYEVWEKIIGNTGLSIEDYLNSIKGQKGDIGDVGPKGEQGDVGQTLADVISDGITFIDQATRSNVLVKIENGELVVITGFLDHIEVTTLPSKTDYTDTELFDPSGMVVTAYYTDGTSKIVTGGIEYNTYVTTESKVFEIKYSENGYTETVEIPIVTRDLVTALSDFIYETELNENGEAIAYHITGWNGTYNGESSYNCILPNNSKIHI